MAGTTTEQRRAPQPRPRSHRHRRVGVGVRVVGVLRPVVFTLAAAAAVTALALVLPAYDPLDPRVGYALRAATATAALAAVVALWWSTRRVRVRVGGADLAAALIGAIAGSTVVVSLNGTPFPPGGLDADQSFRTAAITRFADEPHLADFTVSALPSFYAPAYFWVLGRAADLAGVEPWRMGKVGTVTVALLVPVVTYLLWRRLVPAYAAALIAAVPLLVADVYQPYAWLVLFAIVPWWLEAVHGVRRAGRPVGNPVFLGLVGALLFLTYYYFFFIAALALVLYVVTEAALRRLRWRQVGRAALVLAIAAAASAVYWLPLAVSMLRAEHARSLANRWFAAHHPDLPLPMAEATVTGAVALVGLAYLVGSARRDALSRGLLVLLVAAYAWYALGAAAAAVDMPLLSFRGKPLVPVILLVGGVLGLVRLAGLLAARAAASARGSSAAPGFGAADVRRAAWALAAVLVVYAGQEFVSDVRDDPLTAQAHSQALPDGSLPPHHDEEAEVPDPPAAELRSIIDGMVHGDAGPAVLLSDREDILALYPYAGFLQWSAHYAHPASEFDQRVAVLEGLAGAADADEFAAGVRDNPYQSIDAFVLRPDGDDLVLAYAADDFPLGVRTEQIRFPRDLFAEEHFDLVAAGAHVVAVLR
jgi:galactan 5-O-arabinofuranosyltransferase